MRWLRRWRRRAIGILVLAAVNAALCATAAPAQLPEPVGLPGLVKQPRPDLAVTSILSTWTRFTVANIGTAPAGPFSIALGPSSDGHVCPIPWAVIQVAGLPVGGSIQLEAARPPRDVALPARYGQWIWLDVRDAVLELGESGERTLNLGNNLAFLPGEPYSCPISLDGDVRRITAFTP